MFFACMNCMIHYFLSELLINNPCFRNFGEPFFPSPFAAGNLKMPIPFVLREVPQSTIAQFAPDILI